MSDRAADAPTADAGRPSRSSFGPTVLLGLAGSGLATVGATQTWAEASRRSPGLRTVTASGSDVAPAVLALALVGLACWGTVLVLRRRGRRVVAAVGGATGLGAALSAVLSAGDAPEVAGRLLGGQPDSTTTSTWPVLTAAACLVSVAAFGVAVLRAADWPEMSSRYDAPGSPVPGDDGRRGRQTGADLWKALDRGDDPTL